MHILEIEIASITLAKETPQSILIWQKKRSSLCQHYFVGIIAEIIPFQQRSKFMTCESIVGDYDGQKCSFLYLIHLSCGVHHPTTEVEGELK